MTEPLHPLEADVPLSDGTTARVTGLYAAIWNSGDPERRALLIADVEKTRREQREAE